MTRITILCRRAVILSMLSAIGWSGPWPVFALDVDAARAHVESTLEQVFQLIEANKPRTETAKALRTIFEEKTALPQLARFSVGRRWSLMSSDERTRFTDAFSNYVGFVYAGHFREFKGDIADLRAVVSINRVEDVGAKGVLVHSEIRPARQLGLSVDWLVSDQSGKVAISDVIVEGISLAITQREIIGAMLDARGGDVSKLIADLEHQRDKTVP